MALCCKSKYLREKKRNTLSVNLLLISSLFCSVRLCYSDIAMFVVLSNWVHFIITKRNNGQSFFKLTHVVINQNFPFPFLFQSSLTIKYLYWGDLVSTSQYQQYWYLPHHSTTIVATCFTFSMLAAFSHFEMLDIYWPMYLFHFSLPAVQYPSPLHGHRWITRPGLAQLTEWCCSSENTPLPSYSNGLSAGCPFARRGTQ